MIRKTTIAALASAAALVAPAAAQARQHCQPRGATTIAQNSSARVYAKGGQAYACLKASGLTRLLPGAVPGADQFALGGKWVGFSTSPDPTNPDQSGPAHSILTVMRISDGYVNDRWYPFQTNEAIDKIVVISDGAAAWAITPTPADGNYTIVQGTDRQGHPADQFSDDHTDMNGASLHLVSGKTVGWTYSDGTTGSWALY